MVYSSESLFGKAGASRKFIGRRVARVVPLYWIATTISLLIQQSFLNAAMLATSYAFIPYPNRAGEAYPLYGVGWTLNYEMFFYVLFASAIVLRREAAVGFVTAAL